MNQHEILQLLSVSFLCFVLGGCAGAGLVHEDTGMASVGSITSLQKKQGYVSSRVAGEPETRKEDALLLWGAPDKTYYEGESEVLVYRRELAFSGMVVLLMGINIPLVAPVGYRHTHLFFNDGVLAKAIQEFGGGPYFIYGLMFNVSSGGWTFEWGMQE